jgi:predicted amino acid-binding ACT domain protein
VERTQTTLPTVRVESLIVTVRGQKVILDSDLAALYGVRTKRLNEQVRRNVERFPDDFAFQLTSDEFARLRSQFATSKAGPVRSQSITASEGDAGLRSRSVTPDGRGGRRYRPYAFTEHGAIMAANVLNSPQAVRMSVFVVRAFIKMREALAQNRALAEKLAELERKLTERLDVHEEAILRILGEIKKLMAPPPPPVTPRTSMGFHVKEPHTPYRTRPRRRPG